MTAKPSAVPATNASALDTALKYHRAWASGDFDAAMTHVANDLVCEAPAGRTHGAAAFREFMGPFAAMATRVTLLAAYGDQRHAVVIYDTASPLVASAPGAEHLEVVDGKIVHMRIVFDRLPFEAARHGDSR